MVCRHPPGLPWEVFRRLPVPRGSLGTWLSSWCSGSLGDRLHLFIPGDRDPEERLAAQAAALWQEQLGNSGVLTMYRVLLLSLRGTEALLQFLGAPLWCGWKARTCIILLLQSAE